MDKTLRLIAPDWQAGAKEEYYMGAFLLAQLAPKAEGHIERTVPVAPPDGRELGLENGVAGQAATVANVRQAKDIIASVQPGRIVTLGGNCLVSQAPFDYLHGKYGARLGILWFDAHPDISAPDMFSHEHAMVLANLLGQGDPAHRALVEHPFRPRDILYLGLQPLTADEERQMERLGMDYAIQQDAMLPRERIRAWMQAGGYTKLAVHWDLDVIAPADCHSLYFSEPGVPMFDGASCGAFPLAAVAAKLGEVQELGDIVGFTVAEYLPWDAIRLRRALSGLRIFQ